MNEIAKELMERLRASLPEHDLRWEKEPAAEGLAGSALTATAKGKSFTMQFVAGKIPLPEEPELHSFLEEIVDDFVNFFTDSIYKKEKFTKVV